MGVEVTAAARGDVGGDEESGDDNGDDRGERNALLPLLPVCRSREGRSGVSQDLS